MTPSPAPDVIPINCRRRAVRHARLAPGARPTHTDALIA